MMQLDAAQTLRQQHFFDLLTIKRAQAQYQYPDNPANAIWIHVTDLQEYDRMIDLVVLIREGFIVTRDALHYPPQGDWRDHFRPHAYRFTEKALQIMDNPGRWIFKGLPSWTDESEHLA